MQVFFEKREELAPNIWQYFFRSEKSFGFVPGQYVDLFLPIAGDPRGRSRTFTLTSLPNETLEFVTKHFAKQSPYKTILQNLRTGDAAKISEAMGDLVLPKSPDLPLVFIGGGIGIASYASMLRDLIIHKEERSIFLFYFIRSAREQIFRELANSYPLQLKDLTIVPHQLTAERIRSSVPPDSLIYLSGSQPFVENLHAELESLGMPRSQIVFDYYDGYTEL